ncbi:MAG: acyl-CoA dehydrogenase family protein [Gammaproteobacteria bacterium]|nr:acyl-CoA dehydrogenase family protein [Gammaproteobacteria bacterium]
MSTDSLLLDTVERLFSELLTPEYLAGAERSGAGEFLALTREIGLDTVLVGQEEGGYGGSWSDAFVVAEACGRYAAPGHLPEIMVKRGLGESAEQAEKRSGSLPLPAGALLRSAQMAGAARALLERSVQYCGEREQFGRPVGRFQAVQQQLAELAGYVACMQAASQRAFAEVQRHGMPAGEDDPAWLAVAIAKCRCSELVHPVTQIAHGVHGAIGFTEEFGLQYFSLPLWRWRAEYGRRSDWALAIGRRAIAAGPAATWAALTR